MSQNAPSPETIFGRAIDIAAPADRAAFLDQACGHDPDLRREVEKLVVDHFRAGQFLEQPAAALGASTGEPVVAERPGTTIGPYKLLQQIGEGGFGVVYMAEQTAPIRRKVALKVLKPGMDTRQVVARFEAERQALAIMDHPNIAKVLHGGETDSGRPYFIMELVRGIPITEFCDRNHLPVRKRLDLFVNVCQAVQHAHQKGIIHRDIKPTNLLVTLHDGTPVVKVIDFGIAKALGQQLTEKTLFTNFAQMIGTPLYMSPEQAEMSGLDVDTRSDIYALGVVLYELLTGTTPLDRERLRTVGYDEIRRIIREEEPAKPSTRFSTLGMASATISANRGSDAQRLSQICKGELDWIVMKALEKDRNRRYESASALAADVERYLHDEPVLACPASAWYRFRKLARRKKAALAVVSSLAAAVLIAVAVLATSTVLIARSLQAETQAKDDLRRDSYFHRIALAHSELLAHNLGRALELLDACPADLRDWEWYCLQRLCRLDPVTLQGRGEGIRGVAFHPQGRLLAAANADGTIGLFDPKTGAELSGLSGHKAKVRSVAFHPDGTRLASVSDDLTVKVWDLNSKQVVFVLEGTGGPHAGGASGVAFSPDGRVLAAGSEGGSVILYSADDGRELQRLHGHEPMAICVAFSPDSRLLATGSWTGVLRVWDTQTGQIRFQDNGNGLALRVAEFHPNGQVLATAGYDRQVKLWDVATGKLLNHWHGHDCIILGLAFSLPDGRRLATIGGEDKTVKLWDLNGREILKLRGHTFFGASVAFSPDSRLLVSSALDGTIRIWDATPVGINDRQELLNLPHDDEVWSVAFSPDGRQFAAASWDKTVGLWNAADGTLVHRLIHPSQVYHLAYSRDSKRLVSVGRDKTARIWDTTSGARECILPTPNNHLYGATFCPDGKFLVVDDVDAKQVKQGGSHVVTVWDAQPGQDSPRAIGIVGRHVEDVWCLKFSPNGKLLASASNDGSIKLWPWDPERPGQAQQPLRSLGVRNYGFADFAAFTPDSQRLVTGAGQTVKIWDVATGDEMATLNGHTGDVLAVAVSPEPNGGWLASAGEDTTIILWKIANLSQGAPTLQRRHTLRGHTGMVMSLAFSPDGSRLVSGSRDGTVKVWDRTQWDK